MKNDLRAQLDAALRHVDWHGEQQVLQRLRPRPVRPVRVLVIALVVLAFAATALAVGLHFSGPFTAQRQARQAIMDKYGLTEEMLDLFTYQVQPDGTVLFTTQFLAERLGEYTVTPSQGEWTAAWSHENISTAWGTQQLAQVLPLYRQYAAGWAAVTDIGQLTLEERAALDAPLLLTQETGALINILPEAGDLSPQEAGALAQAAIAEKYGTLPEGDPRTSFFLYGQTQRREYRIDIADYVVYVASPSGEITHCRWMVPAKDRCLPAGNLADYPAAAEEYITSGAFDLLTAPEKAALSQRYIAAGLAHLLPGSGYACPAPSAMSEDAACSLAAEHLRAAYGLPEGWTSLFLCRTSFIQQEEQQAWLVEYLPGELANWHFRDAEKLGVYTVTVDAQAAQVVSQAWSLEGTDVSGCTAESLGTAAAFNGPMLPWVQSLLNDLQAILDKYPPAINLNEMSLEDRGAYAQRMRQAGYAIVQYPDLIPTADDLPQQQAADLAWKALSALTDITGLSRGDADQEGLYLVELADGSYARVWNIVYTNSTDIFTIHVHAETGEIENIWHDSPAFSHG